MSPGQTGSFRESNLAPLAGGPVRPAVMTGPATATPRSQRPGCLTHKDVHWPDLAAGTRSYYSDLR